jgi:hypothetical protein
MEQPSKLTNGPNAPALALVAARPLGGAAGIIDFDDLATDPPVVPGLAPLGRNRMTPSLRL